MKILSSLYVSMALGATVAILLLTTGGCPENPPYGSDGPRIEDPREQISQNRPLITKTK